MTEEILPELPVDNFPRNPFHYLRTERGLGRKEFAKWLGISHKRLLLLDSGHPGGLSEALHEAIAPALREAGITFEEVRKQFFAWVDANSGPQSLQRPVIETEIDQRIMDSIERGFRGIHNIASASGVTASAVRNFLKGDTKASDPVKGI